MPLLIATIASIGGLIGFMLSRRYVSRDSHKTAMFCGGIVVASSAYSLLTTETHALTFRVHVGLLVAMSALLLYRAFRTQRL